MSLGDAIDAGIYSSGLDSWAVTLTDYANFATLTGDSYQNQNLAENQLTGVETTTASAVESGTSQDLTYEPGAIDGPGASWGHTSTRVDVGAGQWYNGAAGNNWKEKMNSGYGSC